MYLPLRSSSLTAQRIANLSAPKLSDVTWAPTACQTFHCSNFIRFSLVDTGAPLPDVSAAEESPQLACELPRESLKDKVSKQPAQKAEAIKAARAQEDALSWHTTEVSRWLDLTEWSTYFASHSLCNTQSLFELPHQTGLDRLDT